MYGCQIMPKKGKNVNNKSKIHSFMKQRWKNVTRVYILEIIGNNTRSVRWLNSVPSGISFYSCYTHIHFFICRKMRTAERNYLLHFVVVSILTCWIDEQSIKKKRRKKNRFGVLEPFNTSWYCYIHQLSHFINLF